MTDDTRSRSTAGRTLFLLGGVAVLFLGWAIATYLVDAGRSGDERLPRSAADHAYLLIEGKKWLVRDGDGDQRADCLLPVGIRAVLKIGTYSAEGYTGRCSRGPGVRTMPAGLRDALTELLALKYRTDSAHTSCLDPDGDGSVDCVVSVHDPETVVLGNPGAACPGPVLDGLSDEQLRRYSEILTLEQTVREYVIGKAVPTNEPG
jgi:hypothetical protein